MLTKVQEVLKKYIVEILSFIYLIYILYITVAPEIYSYVSVWYALDYSYGFGSRLMLGSLLHVITGDFISKEFIYHFIIVSFIILCALISIIFGMVYRKMSQNSSRVAVMFLGVFYLVSPASPAYLWTVENMGRLDTYIFISALVLVLIFFKVNNTILKYLLFISVGVFTLTVHQIYFFLFFPSLLVILIQDLWKSKFDKKQFGFAVGAVIISSSVFLYMQFCSGIYYNDVDTLFVELYSHTDLDIIKPPLEAEYFWTISDHFYKNQLPELRQRIRFGIITIIMLTPIWGTYLYLWLRAIKSYTDKLQKFKYMLMLMTNIAYIPVFALMTDWGRWFAAFFIVAFLNIMVLAYDEDTGMLNALNKLGKFILKYPMLFLVMIIYVASFEKFEGINYLQQVQDFYYATYDLKTFFINKIISVIN